MTVPYWRSDRDYYGRKDSRRAAHLAELDLQERINRRIVVSSAEGDNSYAVVITRREIP